MVEIDVISLVCREGKIGLDKERVFGGDQTMRGAKGVKGAKGAAPK